MITKMIIVYLMLLGEVTVHGENDDRPLYAFVDQHENYIDHAYAEEVVNWYITGKFEYDEDIVFSKTYLTVNNKMEYHE
jgi:hypothetical protein